MAPMTLQEEQARRVREEISRARRIVVLTGAGVSTDSGIPDFQTTDENWPFEVPRAEAISSRFLRTNPRRFWEIYHSTFGAKVHSRPNRFHYFLASLQAEAAVTIVTQNVDGLHKAAGSKEVIAVHGSISEVVCPTPGCGARYAYSQVVGDTLPLCERCEEILKPDVVLFGEQVRGLALAQQRLMESDLLIVAGTSLEVAPICLLPLYAQDYAPQVRRLWLNATPPPEDFSFHDEFLGTFSDLLSTLAR